MVVGELLNLGAVGDIERLVILGPVGIVSVAVEVAGVAQEDVGGVPVVGAVACAAVGEPLLLSVGIDYAIVGNGEPGAVVVAVLGVLVQVPDDAGVPSCLVDGLILGNVEKWVAGSAAIVGVGSKEHGLALCSLAGNSDSGAVVALNGR